MVIIYPFDEAPEEWQAICSQGGDEDYIALCIGPWSECQLPPEVAGRKEYHLDARMPRDWDPAYQYAGISLVVGYHA